MHVMSEIDHFKDHSKFDKAEEGVLIYAWKLGLSVAHNGYVQMNDCCMNQLMEKVYALKYYEGEEITGA